MPLNTNALKTFAQAARKKLLLQVTARMEQVLTTDSAELREQAPKVQKLQEAIAATSKAQVIDKVAYTWFNRLMALRFMDVNDYQPIGVRVVTPKDGGYILPALLDAAKDGIIPEELQVDTARIADLVQGNVPNADPQNEPYKLLLIAACNHLSKIFPFLFERINDYTELLLPVDLISEFSIVQDIRKGMTAEDCEEVEIIGWLYQFYISERKDELINAKKKYKADEIAPVTQLFTPKWIVKYMVANTLGQLWKEARPDTKITDHLEFYIAPNNPETIPTREVKSVEDIRFFDPCMGSGHVLIYAFDIFYKMYEEEGYNPSDIPALILTKNLYGIDIDDRAAQLAAFALMMKGRGYYRRFLRKEVVPNVTAFQNFSNHPKFENAKVLGSLIKISKKEVTEISVNEGSLFAAREEQLIKQANYLANDYDIIVTNPPYLNSSYMEDTLKKFVFTEYKSTKSDLFAAFLIQVSNLTKPNGLIGFICPYVWMFIQSYEELRNFIIKNNTITSLVQLEYNAFGPAVVPIATFTLRNELLENYQGNYVKLSDFKGVENQAPKTLEAIQNPDCGWFFHKNQIDFKKIPGTPIGYWLGEAFINTFKNKVYLKNIGRARKGMASANNARLVRTWYEIQESDFGLGYSRKEAETSQKKWFPYNDGGAFRRWYGNNSAVIFWENDGKLVQSIKTESGRIRATNMNFDYIFKEGLTWSGISNAYFSVRYFEKGFSFSSAGFCYFTDQDKINQVLGLLNSKVVNKVLDVLSPTLNFNAGNIEDIPFLESDTKNIEELKAISKQEWNSRENSWDFQKNELLRHRAQDLEETYDSYCLYWKNKFHQLHRNEEELNLQFIDIYGLQEELTPDVPLEEITILKAETSIEAGELVFDAAEVIKQFVSYAVGCMFGRYSLDQAGLILANQGESLADYFTKVNRTESEASFLPDDDNIIPVLNDEWFEDDIVGRFYTFLKVTFGEQDYEKNLAFIEESLGKSIRKYFVKDFYADHIKRYKKRPIYWMFSSAKGSFNALIYMHRYTRDTLSLLLNNYLVEYREKLRVHIETLNHQVTTGTPTEQTKAAKAIDQTKVILKELEEYEREILDTVRDRISIDLDDGVLVNYNKFGQAIKMVKGLSDKVTKKKVRGFDWIDVDLIK
jgi:type II restriction/modification system DNA methylase subunit YeeA